MILYDFLREVRFLRENVRLSILYFHIYNDKDIKAVDTFSVFNSCRIFNERTC